MSVLRGLGALLLLSPAGVYSSCVKVIKKDVVILGGGASGAHAAVRLREDFGKSVVVVEKQSRLVSILRGASICDDDDGRDEGHC